MVGKSIVKLVLGKDINSQISAVSNLNVYRKNRNLTCVTTKFAVVTIVADTAAL